MTHSVNQASCPKALQLFRSLCNSLLLIYSYACPFLLGDSLKNVGAQLSVLLYIWMIFLTFKMELHENEGNN